MSNPYTRTKPVKLDDLQVSIGSLTVEEVKELILKDMDAQGENGYFTGPVYSKQFSVVSTSLNHAAEKLGAPERFEAATLTKVFDPVFVNLLFTEILSFHELTLKASTPGESSAAAAK